MITKKQVSYPGAGNLGTLYKTTQESEVQEIRAQNSGQFRVLRALGHCQVILVMTPELYRALSKPNYHNTWSFDEKAVPKEWKTWDGTTA